MKVTSATAVNPPKRLVSPLTSSTGARGPVGSGLDLCRASACPARVLIDQLASGGRLDPADHRLSVSGKMGEHVSDGPVG